MKTNLLPLFLLMLSLVSACQRATSVPDVTASVNTEFTLAPDQSAANGPVTVSLLVQQGNDASSNIALQTFTDNDGLSPTGEFEGIRDHVEVGDYLIRVVGVLPYPENLSGIKASAYRVTLMVTPK